MIEYPKIETLFVRNPETFSVTAQPRLPEFSLVREWLLTEKIDGTNIRVEFVSGVGVKFLGRTDNAQMPTFLLSYLTETFTPAKIAAAFPEPLTMGTLYGEGYGPKIQKGGVYRSDGPSFRLFDVRVGDWWLNWPDVEDVARKLGIETAPIVGIATDLSVVAETVKAGSLSVVSVSEGGQDGALAEGVVARTNPLLLTRSGERLMWKLKRKDYK